MNYKTTNWATRIGLRLGPVLMLLTGLLSSCGGASPSASSTPQATSVELIAPNFPQLVDPMKATLGSDFTKRTGIHVSIVPVGDTSYVGVDQRIQADLVAGREPDLALIGLNAVRTYADAHRSQTLDSIMGADKSFDRSTFYPQLLNLGRVGNGTYAVPIAVSTYVLFYNAETFRKAGLDPARPPTTFSDLRKDAQAIVSSKAAPIGVAIRNDHVGDYAYQNFLGSAGGGYMDRTERKVTLDSGVGQSIIGFWRGLYADGLGRPMTNAQVAEAFLNGDAAMMLQSSSYSATLENSAKFDVRSAPYPIPDGGHRKAVVGGAAVAMFSKTPAKRQAEWQVMKAMVSAQAVTNVVKASGYSPVNTEAATGSQYLGGYLTGHRLAQAGWDQLDYLAPWYSFPGSHANEISKDMQDQINQAITGGAPVDVALHRAAEQARGLLS